MSYERNGMQKWKGKRIFCQKKSDLNKFIPYCYFVWHNFKSNFDKSVICSSDKMQCILDFVGKHIKNSKYGNRVNTGFWNLLSVFCSRVMERNLSVHHTCIFNFFLYVVLGEETDLKQIIFF